eukprot:8187910-Pyramimonas_sp.AAC.1
MRRLNPWGGGRVNDRWCLGTVGKGLGFDVHNSQVCAVVNGRPEVRGQAGTPFRWFSCSCGAHT